MHGKPSIIAGDKSEQAKSREVDGPPRAALHKDSHTAFQRD